jgi:hypothetical protein
MSELLGSAPAREAEVEVGAGSARRPRGRLALELVAMRGKDVIGVRHLIDGGTAWVGNVTEAIARISMREYGGQPFLVGRADGATFTISVPPRARGRIHGSDGIPRLVMGPHTGRLTEGERAVLVIGPVQIRAQVVPFETASGGFRMTVGVAGWLAVLAALYVGALGLSTSLSARTAPLDHGKMARIHARFLSAGDR